MSQEDGELTGERGGWKIDCREAPSCHGRDLREQRRDLLPRRQQTAPLRPWRDRKLGGTLPRIPQQVPQRQTVSLAPQPAAHLVQDRRQEQH